MGLFCRNLGRACSPRRNPGECRRPWPIDRGPGFLLRVEDARARNDGAAHTFTGAMMPAGKISSGLARRWAMPCWWHYLESSFIRSKLAIALLLAKRMHFRLWIKLRGPRFGSGGMGSIGSPFFGKDEDIRTRFLNASIEHDWSSGRTRRVGDPPSGCFYPECSLGFAKEIRSKTRSAPDKIRLQIMNPA